MFLDQRELTVFENVNGEISIKSDDYIVVISYDDIDRLIEALKQAKKQLETSEEWL